MRLCVRAEVMRAADGTTRWWFYNCDMITHSLLFVKSHAYLLNYGSNLVAHIPFLDNPNRADKLITLSLVVIQPN